MIQPSILPGFMELLPEEQAEFDALRASIEAVFRTYGFWSLDTPAIEKNEVLFAKGGGETTKQIYRIEKGEHSTEQSLRFDLTVPLARYVAQHAGELAFPFHRYQIAKVYRGERAQKGRYREFYQCDIDIVGREVLGISNDAEILRVIDQALTSLQLDGHVFHLNHRRLLNGYLRHLKVDDVASVLQILDKKEKIGAQKTAVLWSELGLSEVQIQSLLEFIEPTASMEEKKIRLQKYAESMTDMQAKEEYSQGLTELMMVLDELQLYGVPSERVTIDLAITRGLDYYTGIVFETFLMAAPNLGSICSGGRYEDLASNFSKEKFPGVGMSIGLTRLYSYLREREKEKEPYIEAIVLPMTEEEKGYAIRVAEQLRAAGLRTLLYLEAGKFKKKMTYANRVQARFALIVGEEEMKNNMVSVKNLLDGEQETLALESWLSRR